ncbi:MAG: alpha/beta hydrolase [Ruminococcaceae bacterium]|nr:alpha/beta hydrolase [Oscillospiraceae bacterium]
MIFEKIPLSDNDSDVYLETFVTDKVGEYKRSALLVIPGGGYGCVCADREGYPIAQAFMPHGYNAFVLHYTVGRRDKFPCQLIEAARAIKHIKDNAERYNIDPERLFVVGFSAGGHLAASTGVLWKIPEVCESVEMPRGYNKPRGVMLIYPVISARLKHHFGSFQNLWCCDEPTEEQKARTSIEENVDADSAPAFVMHTADDPSVDVRNALLLGEAYSRAGVPFEMHIYPHGPHGIALANSLTDRGNPDFNNERIAEWVRLAAEWANELCKK